MTLYQIAAAVIASLFSGNIQSEANQPHRYVDSPIDIGVVRSLSYSYVDMIQRVGDLNCYSVFVSKDENKISIYFVVENDVVHRGEIFEVRRPSGSENCGPDYQYRFNLLGNYEEISILR